MTDSYYIPTHTTSTEITVRKSRFIAIAGYVSTADGARNFLDSIRDKYPDANHHVHAFRVGYGNSITEGVSDDGEPSGTSGPPILSILRGTDIGDIIIVVVRYFGGTKLGTGGLVRAYGDAARAVLEKLPVEQKTEKTRLLLEVPYPNHDTVRQLLLDSKSDIISEDFTTSVLLEIHVPTNQINHLKQLLIDATAGQITIATFDMR